MLRLVGDLDPFRVDPVREAIRATMRNGSPSVIEIDCAGLTHISAEGIVMLLDLGDEFGRPVVLTHMSSACRTRIRIMGLEDTFEFR
jgi:anti-anti-sigma regulatory factor